VIFVFLGYYINMAQRVDLYTILMSYAHKRHSPDVDIQSFIVFLEKYAVRVSPDRPEWKKWTADVAVKVYGELTPLIEAKKCESLDENRLIRMLDFYAELIEPFYRDIDNNADLPFPDELSLGTKLPEEECRTINIEDDISEYLEEPGNAPVIRIIFPDEIPSMLVLASAIPRPLMDAALLKIRNYLRIQNNKAFFQRRLLPQMQGKEGLLRDAMNMLEIRPLDCILQIQSAAEFTCFFWSAFGAAVKSELKKKEEFLSIDIAAFQSVCIIEKFSGIFKELTAKKKAKDQALKVLEKKLDQTPFFFTMEEILKFTDASGHSLLGQYSQEDLQDYLKSKSTSGNPNELAELLIYRNKKGEQVFINKQKILPVCARLLGEARVQVRNAVGNRWSRLMRDFRKEPSMESDEEFERLLSRFIAQLAPVLMCLLRDKKTYLVQCEIGLGLGETASASRLYTPEGDLIPLRTLLMLKRKDILADTRILLPLWYSIPILSSIIAFFHNLGSGGKKNAAPEDNISEETAPSQEGKNLSQEQAIKASADQIIRNLAGRGKSPDAVMADLENGWQTLLDKEAKLQLITDIKSLIRDRLRRNLRLRTNQKITAKSIEDLAVTIYAEAPALQKLGDEGSITTYIKLYIAKLLLTIKF
jgi:hypothetical protein